MELRREHWNDAFIWSLYNLVGILVPVGITILVLAAMNLDITVAVFTNGGQFAIYSAGMWAKTMYVLTKQAQSQIPRTDILGLICIGGLIVAVAFFVLAILPSNGTNIDKSVVQWPSIGLFLISALLTLVTVALDNSRTEFDFLKAQQTRQRALEEDFDRTEGQ